VVDLIYWVSTKDRVQKICGGISSITPAHIVHSVAKKNHLITVF
jgi:hypothetical protein